MGESWLYRFVAVADFVLPRLGPGLSSCRIPALGAGPQDRWTVLGRATAGLRLLGSQGDGRWDVGERKGLGNQLVSCETTEETETLGWWVTCLKCHSDLMAKIEVSYSFFSLKGTFLCERVHVCACVCVCVEEGVDGVAFKGCILWRKESFF